MDGRDHRVAVGLIACLLAAAPAAAQDEVAPPDGSTVLFREGVAHLREGRHAQAVEAFRGSYRLVPRVTTMCNLALAYDGWGAEHRDSALRAYRTCAAEDESGRFRAHALDRVTAIERELALEGGRELPPEEPREDPRTDGSAEIAPPPRTSPDHALLFAGLGVAGGAAIALGAGIGLALDAQARADALDAAAPDGRIARGSPEARQLDDARALADGATAAYVIAGVLAAASAALVIADVVVTSGDAAPVALRVTPLGVSGAF
ncbi:MAG: hypothetical protein KF729_07575 [Sandaracinaceae bacterium]|nr:hypothetical protein [Sandaracinaceae bacterium]